MKYRALSTHWIDAPDRQTDKQTFVLNEILTQKNSVISLTG